MKALGRTAKKSQKPETLGTSKSGKRKKKVMYEADDIAGTEDTAMNLGMGEGAAVSQAMKRSEELNMPIHKLLARRDEEKLSMSETRTDFTKEDGAVREVTFLPKDVRKRMEETGDHRADRGSSKRKRRGIKSLGFKTPFKNMK